MLSNSRRWLPILVVATLKLTVGVNSFAAQPQDALTELRSNAGRLSVTLQAEEGNVRIGDLDLHGATYNGNYAGPVLRVRPGDLLDIRLVNRIGQPTNLHFHGIRTSPLGNSDNVHITVLPGNSFTYSIRIPQTQPTGLYWYHAHPHGVSEQQIMQGLSGALVVEDPVPLGMTERLFVLKEVAFDDDTEIPRIDNDLHGVVQSVNGNLETIETMRPNEAQLWRFTNQSANRAFHLALQGHRFRVIAEDGERTVTERVVEVLDIAPASRVEVVVEGGAPGRYEILSKGMMTGTGSARTPNRILGHLDVAGEPVNASAVLPSAPTPPDLRPMRIDDCRTVVLTQTNTLKPKDQRFYVNGRTFDPTRIDVRVPLGNVEEWTIRNDSDDMHVFHTELPAC